MVTLVAARLQGRRRNKFATHYEWLRGDPTPESTRLDKVTTRPAPLRVEGAAATKGRDRLGFRVGGSGSERDVGAVEERERAGVRIHVRAKLSRDVGGAEAVGLEQIWLDAEVRCGDGSFETCGADANKS